MAFPPFARSHILSLLLVTLAPVAASANSDDALDAERAAMPELIPEGYSFSEPASLDVPQVDDRVDDQSVRTQERIARCREAVLQVANILESEYRAAVLEHNRAFERIMRDQSLDQTAKQGRMLGLQKARQRFDELINTARRDSTPAKLGACERALPHPRGAPVPGRLPNIDDVESLVDSILLQLANQPENSPMPLEILADQWNSKLSQ